VHIPDGYLGPKTCIAFYAVMLPVWYYASRRVERTLKLAHLPMLALGAAFVFVIMMFNVPVPGGTSGHMTGTVVVAVVLGPWAAVVAVSLAVALQALLFGDGGITALAANAFNMALVAGMAGYGVFRMLPAVRGRGGARAASVAAGAAAYVAINLSALVAALELGVQPALASGPDGVALYAPFGLGVTVPAMVLPHIFIFGPIEALGTALVVSYAYKSGMMRVPEESPQVRTGRLWAALGALVMLTPLGLISAFPAWGEWGTEELARVVGFVPSGMAALAGAWKGVAPGYGGPGGALYYVLSAAAGTAAVISVVYAWGLIWRR